MKNWKYLQKTILAADSVNLALSLKTLDGAPIKFGEEPRDTLLVIHFLDSEVRMSGKLQLDETVLKNNNKSSGLDGGHPFDGAYSEL